LGFELQKQATILEGCPFGFSRVFELLGEHDLSGLLQELAGLAPVRFYFHFKP
jgi:hypothetical protein